MFPRFLQPASHFHFETNKCVSRRFFVSFLDAIYYSSSVSKLWEMFCYQRFDRSTLSNKVSEFKHCREVCDCIAKKHKRSWFSPIVPRKLTPGWALNMIGWLTYFLCLFPLSVNGLVLIYTKSFWYGTRWRITGNFPSFVFESLICSQSFAII